MAPTDVARRVVEERLTYLSEAKLSNLERCVEEIEAAGVEGDVYEAGVALGGSAIVLATLMGPDRSFIGFDVFERIPPPSERDGADAHDRYGVIAGGDSEGIGGDPYYGYVDGLRERVVAAFEAHGMAVDGDRISLRQGLFEDTLRPERPIALAHIDCDWHDPVLLCLERIHPHLSPGGYVILDDYNDWSGCRTATDRFLSQHPEMEVVTSDSNLVARRRPSRLRKWSRAARRLLGRNGE